MAKYGWGLLGGILVFILSSLLLQAGKAETPAEIQAEVARLKAALKQTQDEYATILGLTGTAKAEIKAIGAVLAANPGMAFDFSAQSGAFCLNPGTGAMVHYAQDPTQTQEDIVYMINAQPFIANGLRVENLPPLPADITRVRPGQWYYYAGETEEPHHQRKMPPMLVLAVDVR